MGNLLQGAETMLVAIVLACTIVFFAMMIDLISGLQKAKQRGEIRNSWALKRTLTKFITYEGGMLIAAGVDVLIYLCHLFELFHLDAITGVPFITCLLGIFLLTVEFLSVKEKADDKTKRDIAQVAELAQNIAKRQELMDAITSAILAKIKEDQPNK